MSISNEMRELISGLFDKDVFMGMPYTSLKNRSLQKQNVISLFKQIQSISPQQVEAITSASNTWTAEKSAYTPKQPTSAIDLSLTNEQLFTQDFKSLLITGNDYDCIIFDLDTVDQDTKSKLLMIQFGVYAVQIISPTSPEDVTLHDGYFTSIVKFGVLNQDTGNPYERLETLQTSSSSKLQMMVFPLQDAATAELLEDCAHEDLGYLKHHGEWARTLLSQLRRFVDDHQGVIDGHGRLLGITRENFTSKVLDFSQKDEELFAMDRLIRLLLPLDDIPTDTLPRVYNTGQQKYIVSLTGKEWVNI